MEKELIIPPGTDPAKVTLAPAVRVGNLLYLSGSAGLDPRTHEVPGPDIESQARMAMENLGAVLKAAGSSWGKVVKVTCYLTNPKRDIQGWNKVWREYFPSNPPARTTVGCSLLNDARLIEVDITAVI
jgi:2-iminobutanoate/2-iminopropanoate deaminase